MAAQVTGKGPLAALGEHLNDPINTTIFSKCDILLAAGRHAATGFNVSIAAHLGPSFKS